MNFKHNIFALIFSLSSALNFDGKIVRIPYQFNPRIHNFGNIGIGGIFHSFMARPFTKLIDQVAYDGENIRENIICSLKIENPKFITDFCCGTGTSTEALQKVFSDAVVTGVDTSKEMLRVAKLFTENINFLQENVESVELDEKQDLITLLFGFHEIPQEARVLILENIKNNLKDDGKVLIVDIDTSYKPSKAMLSGEPYVECYLKNIDLDILKVFPEVETEVYIENHVRIWKA
jgi:SAM-dependent methyltransferase